MATRNRKIQGNELVAWSETPCAESRTLIVEAVSPPVDPFEEVSISRQPAVSTGLDENLVKMLADLSAIGAKPVTVLPAGFCAVVKDVTPELLKQIVALDSVYVVFPNRTHRMPRPIG